MQVGSSTAVRRDRAAPRGTPDHRIGRGARLIRVGGHARPLGDSGATVRLILADGRNPAARHLDAVDATALATRLVARSERFERSGVLCADADDRGELAGRGVWVTTPWLDGATGASMLDDPSRCLTLAAGMADLSSLVGNVDPTDLDLNSRWAEPGRLGVVAAAWIRDRPGGPRPVARGVGSEGGRDVRDRGRSQAGTASVWRPVVVHGDFVPINVIVRPDGGLALVDLEDVHVAPRLVDLAWWGFIVRYHHPDAWAIGWPALLAAAGIQHQAGIDPLCVAIARLRVLERAAGARTGEGRRRWLARLAETAKPVCPARDRAEQSSVGNGPRLRPRTRSSGVPAGRTQMVASGSVAHQRHDGLAHVRDRLEVGRSDRFVGQAVGAQEHVRLRPGPAPGSGPATGPAS